MSSSRNIDWAKVTFGLLAISFAATVAWFGRPLIHKNYEAMNVLVTVFSILAGFLIAVISVAGDPTIFKPGTWRIVEVQRRGALNRLVRHKWLFVIYLITLCTVFCVFLFKELYPTVARNLEALFLFFGALSFIFSVMLPFTLVRIQEEKIENEILQRQEHDKIKPD